MAVSVPFAWVTLSKSDLISFSKSLAAVPLFVSNVFFWRDGGYFETASELKPLLHTWSLAVEEQFYLFFQDY
jgi:peptidoglycan/LPS O-acetylase OafA/YrhL